MIKSKNFKLIFLIVFSILTLVFGLFYLFSPDNKYTTEAGGYKEYVYIKKKQQ